MLGVGLDDDKYSKSGVIARLQRRCCPQTGRGLYALDDRRAATPAWQKMASGCLLLVLVCALLYVRVDAAAKAEHIALLERLSADQQAEVARHQAIGEASRAQLANSEAIRATMQINLAAASDLSRSLQQSLDSSATASAIVKEQLTQLQANVGNIDRSSNILHDQLRAKQDEIVKLSLDKSELLTAVSACHTHVNATRGLRLAVGASLAHSLLRIKEIMERKDPADASSTQPLQPQIASLLASAMQGVQLLLQEFAPESKQDGSPPAESPAAIADRKEVEARTFQQFGTPATTQAPVAEAPKPKPKPVVDSGTSPAKQWPFHSPRRNRTPEQPEEPDHPNDQVHFVKNLPLHKQPEHIRPAAVKDTNPAAPFPEAYKTTGRFAQLSKEQAPDVYAKQQAVREEFLHAWEGYRQHAYGFDELHPVSKEGRNSQYYMSLTIIDALDTMIVMGIEDEYAKSRAYLAEYLIFTEQEGINVFETTIRVIGGLLSSFALTNDRMFLDKAEACAKGLLVSFETPTGLPFGTVGLRSRVASNPDWSGGSSSMSEVGTIQMEWQYLSRVTGNPIYEQKVDHVTDQLFGLQKHLYPLFINVNTGKFASEVYTFGARVDSIYEYFLKSDAAHDCTQHLLSGGGKPQALSMYVDSMRAMDEKLIQKARSLREGEDPLTYIAELHGTALSAKMDHLVCWTPGMLALGAWSGSVSAADGVRHMELARQLMRTCHEMYSFTATGLSPEIVRFSTNQASTDPGMIVDLGATHSMMRPETVESLFVMWRVTKDPIYRDWGWEIFQALKKYCRIEGAGYSGLHNVNEANRPEDGSSWHNFNDKMESFFLSETLKYLYLLWSPDELLPLDEWVFNTEAHPLPVAHPPAGAATSATRSLLEETTAEDLMQQVDQLMQASQRREEEANAAPEPQQAA